MKLLFMELFRWRVMNCLLVVMAVLLLEYGLAKGDGGGGSPGQRGSLPAEQSAGDVAHTGHARSRHQRREHRDHKPHHHHRHELPGRTPHSQHRQHAKHQSDAEPKPLPLPLPPPLPRPQSLSRSEDGEAHDLLDCQPEPGDRLLARSVVRAEFRPLGFAEASWFYPQSGRDQRTIHCVRVLDQRRDGYGGYPKVARGGVGHHFVELSFKSDFSRGFHFVVEVYGQ